MNFFWISLYTFITQQVIAGNFTPPIVLFYCVNSDVPDCTTNVSYIVSNGINSSFFDCANSADCTTNVSYNLKNVDKLVSDITFVNLKAKLTRKQLQEFKLRKLVFRNSTIDFDKDSIYELPLKKFEVSTSYNFTEIPDEFFRNSSDLEYLALEHTQLNKIKRNDFVGLKKLIRLYLTGNNLSKIEEAAFDNLISLRELFIANENLSNLPIEIFKNLKNLAFLVLSRNNFNSLPEDLFSGVSFLSMLYLSHNNLTELPSRLFINNFNLMVLNLSYNKIESIPDELFENLGKLEDLLLNNNRLTVSTTLGGDNSIRKLHNLVNLDLSCNNFTSMPDEFFSGLRSLLHLNLSSNELINLPSKLFVNTTKITTLDLSSNKLEAVPDKLFECMSFLQKLYLNKNLLSIIPAGTFENLNNLTVLNLSQNNFAILPEELFSGSSSLKKLDLSRNSLVKLPPKLFDNNSELTTLDISHNKLVALPKRPFENMKNLEELRLGGNQLSVLSLAAEMPRLRLLTAEQNNMEKIDHDLCKKASNLRRLDLSHNNFSPKEISHLFADQKSPTTLAAYSVFNFCYKLKWLSFSYNNIPALPNWLPSTDDPLNPLHLYLEHTNISKINANIAEIYSGNFYIHLSGTTLTTMNVWTKHGESYLSDRKIGINLSDMQLSCNCKLIDFVSYLNHKHDDMINRMYLFDLKNVTCKSPPELIGKNIGNVTVTDLFCEESDCPTKCRCSDYPASNTLLVDCSSKNFNDSTIDDSFLKTIRNQNNRRINLNLSRNELTKTPNLKNFRTNDSSFWTSIVHLDLSSNKISTLSKGFLPANLEKLKLHNNSISLIDKEVVAELKLSKLVGMTFYNNPWTCDCQARPFVEFLVENINKTDKHFEVKCFNSTSQVTQQNTFLLCYLLPGIILVIILILAAISGVFVAIYYTHKKEIQIWLYSKGWCLRFVTEENLDEDKIYDAFVSFSYKDETFVNEELVSRLEDGPQHYKICLHSRDWLAGEFIPNQIARSIEESKRTIIVLSLNFIESEWAQYELRMAYERAINEKRTRVIVILLEEVGNVEDLNIEEDIKTYLKMNTYIKWGERRFWDKLIYAMPHKS